MPARRWRSLPSGSPAPAPVRGRGGRTPPGRAGAYVAFAAAGLLVAGTAYAAYAIRQEQKLRAEVIALTRGDPRRGPAHIVQYGCAGCHTIPGVRRANGLVGPPLTRLAGRLYLGGVLTNRPDNLIRWILNPREVSPRTAMSVTGISEREARDVAAYLLTLR
jgi:cytochrome c